VSLGGAKGRFVVPAVLVVGVAVHRLSLALGQPRGVAFGLMRLRAIQRQVLAAAGHEAKVAVSAAKPHELRDVSLGGAKGRFVVPAVLVVGVAWAFEGKAGPDDMKEV
jgi:hypothetical protein